MKDMIVINGESVRFPWGPVMGTYSVGSYHIVEYLSYPLKDGRYDYEATPEVSFHPYVGSEDTNASYASLDQALIGAVCHRNGFQYQAPPFIFRMLEID